MSAINETPFESIESAQEYLALLADTVDEGIASIVDDAKTASATPGAERRVDALRVVEYKLHQLRDHLGASRRILNDLRSLRRLLLGERTEMSEDPEAPRSAYEAA